MLLHLGENVSVTKEEIIAIIDYTVFDTAVNKKFIETHSRRNRLEKISGNKKTKSLVLTTQGIYLSPISSGTLQKRSMNGDLLELKS